MLNPILICVFICCNAFKVDHDYKLPVCQWWMKGSAIKNSCITKYVFQVLNKIINQWIKDMKNTSNKYLKFPPSRNFNPVYTATYSPAWSLITYSNIQPFNTVTVKPGCPLHFHGATLFLLWQDFYQPCGPFWGPFGLLWIFQHLTLPVSGVFHVYLH